jgi:MFS family permease
MALLVERVQAERAAFYTGIVSAASSLGGFFSGLCLGWLCDRFAPRKLLLPLLIIGGIFTAAMAYSGNVTMLILTKFVAAFAGGGIKPVLQLMLTKITRPELRGTYFGWSGSMNTAGGIVCSFLGGTVIWLTDVRGVYMAAALILIIMIPLMIPTVQAIKNEFNGDPDGTMEDQKEK